MQLSTENLLESDREVCESIYIQEQISQAAFLRQIDRTAAGIKHAFTIGMTALVVLFLVVKVFPQARTNAAGNNGQTLTSTHAAFSANKTQALVAIDQQHVSTGANTLQPVNDRSYTGTTP